MSEILVVLSKNQALKETKFSKKFKKTYVFDLTFGNIRNIPFASTYFVCHTNENGKIRKNSLERFPTRVNLENYLNNLSKPNKQIIHRCGSIKVGVAMHTILGGGIEKWLGDLIENIDRKKIEWSGIVVDNCDLPMSTVVVNRFERLGVPIFTGNNTADKTNSKKFKDLKTAFSKIKDSDVILLLDSHAIYDIQQLEPKKISICHTTGAWQENILKKHLSIASNFAAVSEVSRQAFPRNVRDQVRIILDGIDMNHCHPIQSREEIRKQWNISADKKAIGFIGRLNDNKNPRGLAEAIGCLDDNYVGIFYGEIPPWYTVDERSKLISDIKELSKHKVLLFDYTTDVGSVLNGLDVLVFPSTHMEGFGLILVEAWASGIPTVATPVGAVIELEEKFGKLTTLIDVNSTAQEKADAIIRSLSKRGKLIAEYSQHIAWNHLNVRKMVKNWENYILEIACE